jgi:hypothetical protein
VTLGHIGAVPVEEVVLAFAPAGAAFLYMARAWLKRL